MKDMTLRRTLVDLKIIDHEEKPLSETVWGTQTLYARIETLEARAQRIEHSISALADHLGVKLFDGVTAKPKTTPLKPDVKAKELIDLTSALERVAELGDKFKE
jgi:hypothetical protein